MDITQDTIIGELVAEDYRTAEVFKKYGIDFCCNGNRSIANACENSGGNAGQLLNDLSSVQNNADKQVTNYQSWPLDLLADYIEKKHHRYVEEKTPVLKQYLDKICNVHGSRHPELHKISELFDITAGELAMHMKKEELMLFPYIRRMVESHTRKTELRPAPFGSIQNPVNAMMGDHEAEGERFRAMEELSNNYTPPADACNTYKVTFALLKEFQEDLHLHIHLENNILFPKSIALEAELQGHQIK